MSSYEDCLRRAVAEGWRDPITVTNLEIKAYEAGLLFERKRILFILKDAKEGKPMRAMDVYKIINQIEGKE